MSQTDTRPDSDSTGDGRIAVVVADDERFICQILVRMLERLGLDVVGVAENGEECIQLFEQQTGVLLCQ